jgi:MFS family permease
MLLFATAMLAIPGRIAVVAAGRVLQGLSASVVWTSGLTVLTETFGPTNFGEVAGYVMMSVSISNTVAPLLGGLVYSRGGYFAVSVMTLAVVLVDVVMRLLMVDARQGNAELRPGNGNCKDGLGRGANDGTNDGGYITRAEDPVSETRGEYEPLIRRKRPEKGRAYQSAYTVLLQSTRILGDLWGVFTWACAMVSLETLLPLFVSRVFGWNSMQAGLTFLSWIIPGFLSPLAGKCADKFGARWIIVGAFLSAIPPLVLLRLVTKQVLGHEVLLCGLLVLIGTLSPDAQVESAELTILPFQGLALTFINTPVVADLVVATTQLKQDHLELFGDSDPLAQVYGLFIFAYSSGALVGPAVVGVLKTQVGWGAAMIALACACGVACVPIIAESGRR